MLRAKGGVRLACGLVLIGHLQGAFALEEGGSPEIEWLKTMRAAVSNLSYQGNVSYIKDQQVDSFRLYHARIEGVEREHLISMNSPLREVVRVGGNITRYAQDAQQVAVEVHPAETSLLVPLPDDPRVLDRYYQLSLRGREYVAGFPAQVVALEPRDGYRYSRLIWIDVETRLPLKLDVINEEGQSVEQVVFTSLNTKDPIQIKDLEPAMKALQPITQINHRVALPLKDLHWVLNRVPDGFQIVAYSTLRKPVSQTPVEQILLSDGFSAVSVYVEPKDEHAASGSRRMGAVNVAVVAYKDRLVTVMGEVPLTTVEWIAKGFGEKTQP